MKHVLRLSVFAAVMLMALPGRAVAADMGGLGDFGINPYIGVGLGVYDLKFSGAGFNQGNNVFGGMFRVGADFNDYLGVELRVGGTDVGATGNTRQKASYLFSYLAKIQFPVTQELRIYGLAGATTGRTHFTQAGIDYAGKVATGASFGGGIDYSVDDFMDVGVEYMRYWNGVGVNKVGSPAAKEDAASYLATLRIMM